MSTSDKAGPWLRAGGYDTHYDGKWHIALADLSDPGHRRPLATNDDDGVIDRDAISPFVNVG